MNRTNENRKQRTTTADDRSHADTKRAVQFLERLYRRRARGSLEADTIRAAFLAARQELGNYVRLTESPYGISWSPLAEAPAAAPA